MNAVHLARHGGPELLTLVQVERPQPGPGEVLPPREQARLGHGIREVRRTTGKRLLAVG